MTAAKLLLFAQIRTRNVTPIDESFPDRAEIPFRANRAVYFPTHPFVEQSSEAFPVVAVVNPKIAYRKHCDNSVERRGMMGGVTIRRQDRAILIKSSPRITPGMETKLEAGVAPIRSNDDKRRH